MALEHDLEQLMSAATAALATAPDAAALEELRVQYLGRNGRLKELSAAFGAEPPERKRIVGPLLSQANEALREAFHTRAQSLRGQLAEPPIDLTLPVPRRSIGAIHPLSQVADEVEDILHGMGFTIEDGPHVEEDRFNFTALNIPEDHPARESHDTFWLKNGRLLRTHTSAVQARLYAQRQPPIRSAVIGRVFRFDEIDATHDNTFTQVEGFVVDEGITAAHLLATLRALLQGVLRRDDIEVRLRPSFFPFVEPGFEVDVRITGATGRFARWVELLGCGMIHPAVLEAGGIDSSRYNGYAFGIGLERITMMRHGIQDIRLFNGADLRGLRQFA
jgi:phenylalanyl-tRNA synthetase alpha chain